MTNLKIIFSILICLLFTTINAQQKDPKQYTFATFEIRDVRYNKDDVTPQFLEENASLFLYKWGGYGEILMSVFCDKSNSQSYGQIYSITKEENPNKDEEFKHDLYHFYWSYFNTYDNKEGTAEVKLLTVYKPQGTYFEITILPENLDEFVYKGKMDGDFLVLDFNIRKQADNP